VNTFALKLQQPWAGFAAWRDLALLCAVTIATLACELALAERKYAIFGGGFGQSKALADIGSVGLFALVLGLCHGLLVTIVLLMMQWAHCRLGWERFFRINAVLLVPATWAGSLIAKYEAVRYFSDAISFELVRKLGGGSLFDALLFVLSESALMAGTAVVGIGSYVLLLRWWSRRRGPTKPSEAGSDLRISLRAVLLAAIMTAAALWLTNGRADVRSALWRFNSVWLIGSALEMGSDFDRDGYGLLARPADAHPFDGSRYPYALDIPGNGLDEDGIGGDFQLAPDDAGKGGDPTTVQLPNRRKHLIVIVLESTRADALGKRFAARSVTPHMDALAAAGSSFPAAYSHVGFTTDSLKSIFSGRFEPKPGEPSLFRDLKANGYRIGVFSGQPESFGGIAEATGMRATADVFRDGEALKAERASGFAAKSSLLVDGDVLLREFDRAFGRREAWNRPVFLYFNLQSAHFPYHYEAMRQLLPGRPIPRAAINEANKNWVAATYWNAVAHTDRQLGTLIGRLKALGVYDDTIILVTADHGESLFDDGFLGHGHMLNRQQTQVPLVLNVPGVARADPIGLNDYRALLLKLLAGQVPELARNSPVLQYIGTLDRPGQVGIVEPGQRWTILKLEDRSVSFSDSAGTFPYETLASQPRLKARADRLVATWESERWAKHLRASKR
jgi:hypothetical protein